MRCVVLAAAVAAGVGLWCGDVSAGPVVYVRSSLGQPWSQSTNETAMDRVFGSGNWSDLRYETLSPAAVFSAATPFAYLEGGDNNANALKAFLTANQAAIQSWVNAGGRLLVNAAPNEGGNIGLGFGVTLNYNGNATSGSQAAAVNPGDPVFAGPFGPAGPAYTGTFFSHAFLTGGGLTPWLTDEFNRTVLGGLSSGAGSVVFGGLTTDNFHSPQPNAANLRANVIAFASGAATRLNDPRDVPEPATWAVFAAVGFVGGLAGRQRKAA